jgi:3-phenylpropionate/cinnamic acid dioxygenase small subunit
MAPDIRYWAPVREDVDLAEEKLEDQTRLMHFDESGFALQLRVRRMMGSNVHSDSPPARTRHFITNVRISGQDAISVTAESNFLLFKSRLGEEELVSGRRIDQLAKGEDGLRVKDRCIVFDHSALPSLTSLF